MSIVMKKKIAVLVSGGGTNLQALIDAQTRGDIQNGAISLVISSNADAFALQRAKKADIETVIISRAAYQTAQEMTLALVNMLREHDIDLVVMAGFMVIVTKQLIDAFPNAIINVHPALIPAFSGAGCYGIHVHEKAISYGVKISGATVHFVDETCDGGPIIAQRAVEVLPDDSPQSLQQRIMKQAEWTLLPMAVSLFCQNRLKIDGRCVTIMEE